jgi:predicted DCC family thiol-disulfide oxidoreductase YuxK
MQPITIVYDGLCHLCSGSIAWIARRVDDRVHFVPVQSDEGAEALKALGLNALDPESFLVVKDGQCLQKSTAVIAALNVVGGGWKMVAWLLGLLPRSIADRIYDWVAANRYKWFENARRVLCPGRKATLDKNDGVHRIVESRPCLALARRRGFCCSVERPGADDVRLEQVEEFSTTDG